MCVCEDSPSVAAGDLIWAGMMTWSLDGRLSLIFTDLYPQSEEWWGAGLGSGQPQGRGNDG